MNQYFFAVSKADKQNILNQHRKLYDGYTTLYGQQENTQPLYVQDLANDKGGITVSNKGNVTTYKNVGINENRLDRIGDGPMDLKNGTIDLDSLEDTMSSNHEMMHDDYPSPNEDETDVTIISLGTNPNESDFDLSKHEPIADVTMALGAEEENDPKYEFDIDELENFMSGSMNELYNEIDEEIVEEFEEKLNESLDMFRRFKKYN